MKKIIFTADDFGALDFVDKGVYDGIEMGFINSVAALVNHPKSAERIRNLYTDYPDIEIGLHFTVTSGWPLAPLDQIPTLHRNGKFRTHKEFQFKMKPDEIRKELEAQLRVFDAAGVPCSHLSSHHGSLDFFEKHHRVQIEFADHHGIPVRSPVIKPGWKRVFYHEFIKMILHDDLNNRQMDLLKHFQYHTSKRRRVRKLLKKYGLPNIKMPDGVNGTHTGIPGESVMGLRRINYLAKQKRKNLLEQIEELDTTGTMEFVFHLIDNKYSKIVEWIQLAKDEYPNVNPGYFDGRMAEYRSLKALKMNQITNRGATFGKWSEI